MKDENYTIPLTSDGSFEIDGKPVLHEVGDTFLTKTIRMTLKQLESYRGSTANPAELEWEIRLYKYILNSPNKNDLAADYARERQCKSLSQPPVNKRKVVKKLGWVF